MIDPTSDVARLAVALRAKALEAGAASGQRPASKRVSSSHVPTPPARMASTGGGITPEPDGAIAIAFAQLNVRDRDGDVLVPGCIPVGRQVILGAYNHSSLKDANPVGLVTLSEEQIDGATWAVARGRFFTETEAGREALAVVRGLGGTAEYSFGYQVVKSDTGRHQGQPVRFLRQLDVFEVSPVVRGAGIGTRTLAIKGASPEMLKRQSIVARLHRDMAASALAARPQRERDIDTIDAARRAMARRGQR